MADQENDGENSDDSSNPQNTCQDDDAENPEISSVESTNNEATTSIPRRGNTNIVSLSSYKSDDHNTEEGQAYYAGGSVNSGQQIIGPDKKKSKNPTEKLFEAAKKHGATVASEQSTSGKSENKTFCGAGYKLGSDVEPSEQVSPSLLSQHERNTDPPTVCVLKIWSNGFSIDSGPLRDFNEPSSKMFLATISKGEVPLELRQHAHNAEVNINMEDHHEEEYIKILKAFSGKGQMLGSPCPSIFQEVSTSSPLASQGVSSTPSPPENSQNLVFQVNESKPVTSIQIRLADGTRLVTKFNHDSTIGDIRNVVRNARPNAGNFNLMTTFPNKILTDDNVSIVDAKLLNAVIVQRMT